MRWTSLLAGASVGAVLALLAIPAHRHGASVGDVVLPWGLAVALATPLAWGVLVRDQGRATLGVGIGWGLVLVALLPGGPGGDYVYMDDVRGWGLIGGGVAVSGLLLALGLSAGRSV